MRDVLQTLAALHFNEHLCGEEPEFFFEALYICEQLWEQEIRGTYHEISWYLPNPTINIV